MFLKPAVIPISGVIDPLTLCENVKGKHLTPGGCPLERQYRMGLGHQHSLGHQGQSGRLAFCSQPGHMLITEFIWNNQTIGMFGWGCESIGLGSAQVV
eukprot:COSAG02_NODE_76_length_41115_cov_60.967817_33_plen_98_part_00